MSLPVLGAAVRLGAPAATVRLGGRSPGGLGTPDCGDIVAGKSGWLRCVRANVAAARSVVSLARCCAALRRCSASHITLPGRLELPTLRLTASRSSQLSYGSLAPLVSLRAPARLAAEPERERESGNREVEALKSEHARASKQNGGGKETASVGFVIQRDKGANRQTDGRADRHCKGPRSPRRGHALATVRARMVPRGLEPRTLRLLAVRSNQLSYETTCGRETKRSPQPSVRVCPVHAETHRPVRPVKSGRAAADAGAESSSPADRLRRRSWSQPSRWQSPSACCALARPLWQAPKNNQSIQCPHQELNLGCRGHNATS